MIVSKAEYMILDSHTINSYAVVGFNSTHDKESLAVYYEIVADERDEHLRLFNHMVVELEKIGIDVKKLGSSSMLFFDDVEDTKKVMSVFSDSVLCASQLYAYLFNSAGICIKTNLWSD